MDDEQKKKKELPYQEFGFANVQNMKTKFVALKRHSERAEKQYNHLQFIVDVRPGGTCTECIKQLSRFTWGDNALLCFFTYYRCTHTHTHSCIDSINNSVVAFRVIHSIGKSVCCLFRVFYVSASYRNGTRIKVRVHSLSLPAAYCKNRYEAKICVFMGKCRAAFGRANCRLLRTKKPDTG